MRRLLRRRSALTLLALLVVAVLAGGWAYSRSDAAARRVSRKLEARLGATARVDRLHLGLTETSVTGLAVFETGPAPPAEPFLTAAEVDLNVSAVGAALGRPATEMHVRGAHLVLRYDRAGYLLTWIPQGTGAGPLPTIHLETGTLTIRQEGREDAVFQGLRATLTPAEGGFALDGTADDPVWGRWVGEGLLPAGRGKLRLAVRTLEPRTFTPEILQRVPLVSPTAWKYVTVAGTSPAGMELNYDPAVRVLRCRIEMEPTAATVHVPAIDLHVTDGAGRFVSEGRVITLTDVRGKTADGTVRVDSRMDFSGPDYVLTYTADLSGLDVHRLPRKWRFPKNIAGRLSGRMLFKVTLTAAGDVLVDAAGRTLVTEARLNGEPVEPIEMDVRQGSGGLEFARRVGPGTPQALKPLDLSAAFRPGLWGRGLMTGTLRLAAFLLNPPDAPKGEQDFLHLNLTLRDVDLDELLRTIQVETPVKIAGKVTARVRLDVPTDTPDELKSFRLSGTLTAARVTFDDLALEDVSATLDLRDGKLDVKELVGKLPSAAGREGGTLRVQGEFGLGEGYPFRATVRAEKLPLENAVRLRSLLPEAISLAGEADARATVAGTLDPVAVQSRGDATVTRLRAGPVPVDRLAFRWESDADTLRIRDAKATLLGGEATGELDLPFRANEAGTGTVKVDNLDLGRVATEMLAGASLRLEGKAAGSIKLRSPAAAEGGPAGTTVEIDLQAPALKFQGIPARRIKGKGTYAAGVVRYTLAGEALGGQVEVEGQYPPAAKPQADKPAPEPGRLRFRQVRMSGLWEALEVSSLLGALDADLSGELPLDTDADGQLVGTGRVRADRIRWSGTHMPGAGLATVKLTPTGVAIEDATLHAGTGVLRFRMRYDRADPDRGTATVNLTNVPAARLLYLLPELASHVDMNVDGRLTTRMGREWRGSGVLTAARGKVYGIPVSNVRVPVEWVITPSRGRAQLQVREATATAASGHIAARTEVNLYNDLPPRIDGEVQFKNANLSQAFREAGQVAGNLQMSGTLAFGADQYRGPADMTARLGAKLGESQPFLLPVFSAMVPYIGSVSNSSTTINEGELKATLGEGVWRVERLTLSGSSLDLYADGSVSTAGRLNLAVTATSRQRPSQAVVRRVFPGAGAGLSLDAAQPLGPVGMANALGFLGNYVVHMEVGGSVSAPAVRVQTLRTLTDAAVRFFLLRYMTGIP